MIPFLAPAGSRAVSISLVLCTLMMASPVVAADSPEAALNALIDTVASGDFSTIDQLVCESEREAVLAQFDPTIALGLPPGSETVAAALAFQLSDIDIDIVDEQAESALAHLTATLTIAVDDAQARELVRVMAELDGQAIDEAELDFIVPIMLESFGEAQLIDDDVTLVRLNDQWLVCGGLGVDETEGPNLAASVSFDGICGLASLADVNAVGPAELAYDSSYGEEDYCSYSSTSYETYYSTTLSLERGEDVELYRSFYPDGLDVTVSGLPAYTAADQLFVGLAEGVLLIDVLAGETLPADFDGLDYMTKLARLFIPLIPELEVGEDAGAGDLDFDGSGQPSLCDAISTDTLATLSGLPFDDASGDSEYCAYSSSSDESGLYVVTTSLEPSGLADQKLFFPGGQDITVAGRPAYAQEDQLWVELDGGLETFGVGLYFVEILEVDDLDLADLARRIAEAAVPAYLANIDPGA